LQGARLNAFELRQDRFDTTLISDTAVGYILSHEYVNKVIVGADRITRTGHLFNKIGTYQIAVLAKKHEVPFYTAAPYSTIDPTTDWEKVVVEERGVEDVVKVGRKRIAPKGIVVLNPAFDMTPPDLIDAIITDKGVLRAPYEESITGIVQRTLAKS